MATGTAVQVVVANENHTFTLDESALSKILNDPRVKDSHVIVLSIAGAFRQGKSFILNFFLYYFLSQRSKNWIYDRGTLPKGFDWKSGKERHTTGILMWSEPFRVTLANGEQACVLLMDTQGTFDNKSTVMECATIFALSTMLSSVQVYNLMKGINENDLQHLQLFAEYARFLSETNLSKPLQDLCFLVRDWQCTTDHDFGREGGQNYLAEYLEIKKDQSQELQNIRSHVSSCFTRIECFLMPDPGKNVMRNKNFGGRFSDIDKEFLQHVQEFVTHTMSTENLVIKEIDGGKITGKKLFDYFKKYIELIRSNKLPQFKSVSEVTAEVNNLNAVSKAIASYTSPMEWVIRNTKPYVKPETLEMLHERYLQEAVELFNSLCMMVSQEMRNDSQMKVKCQIIKVYSEIKEKHSMIMSEYHSFGTTMVRAATAVGGAVVGAPGAFIAALKEEQEELRRRREGGFDLNDFFIELS